VKPEEDAYSLARKANRRGEASGFSLTFKKREKQLEEIKNLTRTRESKEECGWIH